MKKPPDAVMFLIFAALLLICAMVLTLTSHPVPTWMTGVLYAMLLAAGVTVVPGGGVQAAATTELRRLVDTVQTVLAPSPQPGAVIPAAGSTAAPVQPIPPDPSLP
jgi:ABC-type dipeptide/oligopeptide/nickel transport system permease component